MAPTARPSVLPRARVGAPTAFRRAAPCRHRTTVAAVPDPSPDDPASYATALSAAASDADWVRCLELATEVRVLKLALPAGAYGAAARAVADGGGPWRKAVDLLTAGATVAGEPGLPCDAVTAVFWRLARETEGAAACELLDALTDAGAFDGRPPQTRGAALNAAARACGRGGDLDRGLALLDALRRDELAIEDGTFSALSLACLAAGRPDLSEELLEERDYL